MNKMSKGLQALHGAIKPPFSDVGGSASDAIADAIRAASMPAGSIEAAEQHEQAINETFGEGYAEQSKPLAPAAPTAPSLFVSGIEAIRQAGAATEQDRIREYGLLAEIEAKLTSTGEELEQVKAMIETTEATLAAAHTKETETFKTWEDLEQQRAETVDRIVKLNQTAIDHEAARLRRGS